MPNAEPDVYGAVVRRQVWLTRHLVGEHMCPLDETEEYASWFIQIWLMFMAHSTRGYADEAGDEEAALQPEVDSLARGK